MKCRNALAGFALVGLVGSLAATSTVDAATKKTTKTTAKATKTTAKGAAITTKAAAATTALATTPPAGGAKTGGKLIFGTEAEIGNWIPGSSAWGNSGNTLSFAVVERLFALDAKGSLAPWLADSMTVDRTGLVWTIKVKRGIKFHNGELFNADAVKANLDSMFCGTTLALVFFRINGGTTLCTKEPLPKLTKGVAVVDDSTVTVTTLQKFPGLDKAMYTVGGAMVAPQQLKENNTNILIGTGPFKFKSYKRDVALNVVRNDDYWRKDHMAKLDEIEFRPIPDENARIAQVAKGDLDMTATQNYSSLAEYHRLAKDGKVSVVSSDYLTGTNHDVLNNAIAPFNVDECRLAAAYALDVSTLIKLKAPGAKQANGPFAPGTPGWVANSGAPTFNLDKARANYEICKTKLGVSQVEFTMATTTEPEAGELRDIMAAMEEKAGFRVKTVNIEPTKYSAAVITGATQWATFGYYSGWIDLDTYRFQLASESVTALGAVALNWQRVKDAQVDSALDLIRDNTDAAVRSSAAEAIFRQYAEKAYILPRWNTVYSIVYGSKVTANLEAPKLSNGGTGARLPLGFVTDFADISKS